MSEIPVPSQQKILVPVLIGGAVMALVTFIPILNLINVICCAGVIGAAILATWFYKKSYPADSSFGPKQGAKVGALSGIVGAIVFSLLSISTADLQTEVFQEEFRAAWEESMSEMSSQGQDTSDLENIDEIILDILNSPMILFSLTLGISLIAFVGFGAIGGAIGGKIFKSKGQDITPQSGFSNTPL